MAVLTSLTLPGDELAWTRLGFAVAAGGFRVGLVHCAPGGEPAWDFDETHADATGLGVPTGVRPAPAATDPHPNGITAVDHVVYTVPELDAAVARLTAVLGAPPRRRFHPRGERGPEMAFFRVGEAFVEVVGAGAAPTLAGVAFAAPDLDATVAAIRAAGGPVGDPKPAVQGGRIISVGHGHLDWGVAVMGR